MTGPEQKPPTDAAQAIALQASRLQRLALKHKYHFLAYLLEMVLLEAWREASGEANDKCETLPPVDADPLSLED